MKNNPFNTFTVHELTSIIDDTIFDKSWDKDIALNVYVKSMTVEHCAELVNLDSKTVQKRLHRIKDRINATIFRQNLAEIEAKRR